MTLPPAEGLPAAALSGDVTLFCRYLDGIGQDYLLVDQVDDQHARLRFCGPFLGQKVIWDCEFVTLSAVQASRSQCAAAVASVLRNFIDVGAPGPRGVPLRVGLAVAYIDQPAIEKMVIMIRNYKHLHAGRHEYGHPYRGGA